MKNSKMIIGSAVLFAAGMTYARNMLTSVLLVSQDPDTIITLNSEIAKIHIRQKVGRDTLT